MSDSIEIHDSARPFVQEHAEMDGYIEVVFPRLDDRDMVYVLPETVAMEMFSEMMRIVTGIDPDQMGSYTPAGEFDHMR